MKSLLRVTFWIEKKQCVRFRISENTTRHISKLKSTTRQILNWKFYNVSDFECTSVAVCQTFLGSSKQSKMQ